MNKSLITLGIIITAIAVTAGCTSTTSTVNENKNTNETTVTENSNVNAPTNSEQTQITDCEESGGTWKTFSNGCVDSCAAAADSGVICTQAFTEGCDCGGDQCWDEVARTCEDNPADVTEVRVERDEVSIETETGLRYIDDVVGDGQVAQAGDEVSVHYVGTLDDGTQFDSSRDRGTPFEFDLGAGQVIAGWDEGVAGMAVGGTRTLVIPPDLGYGSRAVGTIPANSTLTFEVELLEIN